MSDTANIIRGVLIQVADARLLLPNATIAEVLSYADPEPVENTPDWLLGRMRWRDWKLPLVSFSRFTGIAEERGGLGSKVIVLKALGGDSKHPFFALLTQGFPRLVTVTEATLATEGDDGTVPEGVLARVRLNEDNALLPDLNAIEDRINEALAAAA
ncbi:MAG TPA: chemotaxis protein CheW [Thermomonas sp.]|nr:chemotaxis protein CheW [Thermomonas sp.]